MNSTHETTGVVERGTVKLPPDVQLPDGTTVRVSWNEAEAAPKKPYDRQPLTEDDVRADLAWATKESRAT
jgi:hypothetical protein